MFETGKRWRVPYLLYLLVAIIVAEIAFNGDSLPAVSLSRHHSGRVCLQWGPPSLAMKT